MWGKFFRPGAKNQTSQAQNKASDELLETQLEQLHYRANPHFEQDLKARLLANLAEQPAPTRIKNRRWEFNPARSAALTLTGAVGLALAVIVISVLTVQTPASTVSQLSSPVTVAPIAQTALPSVAISPASTAPSVATVAEPTSETGNVTSTDVAIAVATMAGGAAPPAPGYLPAGYKLQTSEVITPDEKNPRSFSGYYLRYQAANEKDKAEAGLEISQWQMPSDLKITLQPAITGMYHPGQQPPTALLMGGQKVMTTTINGELAYNVGGPRWRIQMPDVGGPQSASAAPPQTPMRSGFGGMPMMNTSANYNASVSFSRSSNGRNEYFIDYGWRGSPKNVRTIFWQRANVLTLVSANSLSDEELARVAGSVR